MSSYAIIADTSQELRRRIFASLTSAPDSDFGLTNLQTDITLKPPSENMTGTPHLSLYLYRVDQDGHLRNQPWLSDLQTGLRFPPLPLKLYYLITPLEAEEDQNQLMLGRIMQTFHDQPIVDAIDGEPLDDSHGGNSPRMQIAFEPLSLEAMSQLWGILRTEQRLSTAYSVRSVAVDSAQALVAARRVEETLAVLGLKD